MKDRILDPVARALPFASPNLLTLLALGLGVGAAVAAWHGQFGLGLGLWLGNRAMDGLDGAVARVHGKSTDLGGYLDLLADFVVYGAVPVALALRPEADPALAGAALILLATFYVNAASWMVPAAILEKRNQGAESRGEPTTVTLPEGLVAGSETLLFYSLFFLFPVRQAELFHFMAALMVVTVLQRLVWAGRVLGSQPEAT